MNSVQQLKQRWYVLGVILITATLLFSTNLPVTGRPVSQEGISQPQAFTSGGTMNFQGQLSDMGGNPLNGSYNMRFAIYSGENFRFWPPIWTYEEHIGVIVNNGLFDVQLGSMNSPITPNIFNGQGDPGGDRYLQVWICKTAGPGCADYDDMGRLAISSSAMAQHLIAPAVLTASNYETALIGVTENGTGILGHASKSDSTTFGNGVGVRGSSNSTTGTGVYGLVISPSGINYGVFGRTFSTSGRGVYGEAMSSSGTTYGVYGISSSPTGVGVFGRADTTTGTNFGVYGRSDSVSGYAGYFQGRLHATGNITAGGTKSFIIDHPLDPENQYLYHYSMEGPEPYNIYRGTALLDESGSAWVDLPDYFEALNADFNYQLTPIGKPMPNLFVAEGVANNRFLISGGESGAQVSWVVTALRNDPWVQDQNLQAEVPKTEAQIGKFVYPQGYGLPQEFSVDYNPELMVEMEDPVLTD